MLQVAFLQQALTNMNIFRQNIWRSRLPINNGSQQLFRDGLNKRLRKINNTSAILLQTLRLSPHPVITLMISIIVATSKITTSLASNIKKTGILPKKVLLMGEKRQGRAATDSTGLELKKQQVLLILNQHYG